VSFDWVFLIVKKKVFLTHRVLEQCGPFGGHWSSLLFYFQFPLELSLSQVIFDIELFYAPNPYFLLVPLKNWGLFLFVPFAPGF